MSDPSYLPCPVCGTENEFPLATVTAQPRWACSCGFEATLPVPQLRDMIAKIEQSKRLLRNSAE